jgi:hypothetical protein
VGRIVHLMLLPALGKDREVRALDRWLTDVMEAARCRLEVDMKNLNLFLVPRSPERPSADGLCSIINDSLCPEFPTCIFEAELPRAGLLDEETSYVCIAVDSSRPEKVKDMIKERLWVVRGNGRAPAKVEDVLHGRWSKKAPEFRLEDYGFFIPFRVMGKSEGVRTLSFHHRPTFYRYRVALTRVSRTPESLREYLLALFTSCPNHLFNRGTFRASGVRESSLDIEIPLQEMSDHEIVALARRKRSRADMKTFRSFFLSGTRRRLLLKCRFGSNHGNSKGIVTF